MRLQTTFKAFLETQDVNSVADFDPENLSVPTDDDDIDDETEIDMSKKKLAIGDCDEVNGVIWNKRIL